ncbi:hypothetical protein [Leptolyngbya sp. O-77]|uniref:hypothetical protein n=1 Tax=Leptolyngbya sp. O-77 TaxID=1080068 RepID=UPI00074D49BC|nr:hypothetical protein [Leptolyngbya sp. O-77]BAU44109.1 hypothetical protein O77CONTIG1_03945 [Leptolyngbya sp. O-77]
MSTYAQHAGQHLAQLLQSRTVPQLEQALQPKPQEPPPQFPGGSRITPAAVDRRWKALGAAENLQAALLDPQTAEQMEAYRNNIENFIGHGQGSCRYCRAAAG